MKKNLIFCFFLIQSWLAATDAVFLDMDTAVPLPALSQHNLIDLVPEQYRSQCKGLAVSNTVRAGQLYAGWYLHTKFFPDELIEAILQILFEDQERSAIAYERCEYADLPSYNYWVIQMNKVDYRIKNPELGCNEKSVHVSELFDLVRQKNNKNTNNLNIDFLNGKNHSLVNSVGAIFIRFDEKTDDVYYAMLESKGNTINCGRIQNDTLPTPAAFSYIIPEQLVSDKYNELIISMDNNVVYIVPAADSIDRYIIDKLENKGFKTNVLSPWRIIYNSSSEGDWFARRVYKKNKSSEFVVNMKKFHMLLQCFAITVVVGGLSAIIAISCALR